MCGAEGPRLPPLFPASFRWAQSLKPPDLRSAEMHAGMRRPPTITCGRALRTGRIRPRASGLSASLFQDGAQERGALHFAGVAGPQAGDPDGYAVDFAVALPAEPADLTERV